MHKQTRGPCLYCNKSYTKAGMARHLLTCNKKKKAVSENSQEKENSFFLLQIGVGIYWLYLEIPTNFTLLDLDQFLRDTWLECCGHLSQFRINDTRYMDDPDLISMEEYGAKDMNSALTKVLRKGSQFTHEYDFGSTTELNLKVVDLYSLPIKKEMTLIVKNDLPHFQCDECETSASQTCPFCWEDYCEECGIKHPCIEDSDQFIPILDVNSPRAGVCGYPG